MTTKGWQHIDQVVVVGLGITGLSVVNYLKRHQPSTSIKVIDTRSTPPGAEQLPNDVELHCGSWQQAWLNDADLIVVNPGIALATPELQAAIEAGIPVVGDIELFAWHADKPVIAITGSNGKSTVTDLTGEMAKACGLKVGVGGNIGVPALDLLNQDNDLYVLELSSFQLETTSSLELVAAAFLNLSEDHMDRYHGMADYRQAKLRIFDNAKYCVVNLQDEATYPDQVGKAMVSFGLDSNADFGLMTHQGAEWLAQRNTPIMASSELTLVGRHNLANVLVVLALLDCAGIDYKKALTTLRNYSGLTHRCQVVADNQGIKWINDSKATNVASTLAALSGLKCAGSLYLLVGGVGKGADFSELKPALASLPVELCCFGRDALQFMPLHPSAKHYATMQDVIADIAPRLKFDDMVMLSPACASFDQFSNFMARGDEFAALAQQYAFSLD